MKTDPTAFEIVRENKKTVVVESVKEVMDILDEDPEAKVYQCNKELKFLRD